MSRLVTQTDVELEIVRLSGLCEEQTDEYATRAENAASADSKYKSAFARAVLAAEAKTVSDREAMASIETEELYERRRIAEALFQATQEKGRNLRAQLDALRSISASVRHAVANSSGVGR